MTEELIDGHFYLPLSHWGLQRVSKSESRVSRVSKKSESECFVAYKKGKSEQGFWILDVLV